MVKKLSNPEKISPSTVVKSIKQHGSAFGLERLTKLNWYSLLLILLFLMFVYLQAILWIGDGSIADVWRLKKAIAALEQENQLLRERNQTLINEVEALRHGTDLIENHAREDLGLVKQNEIFYHVIDDDETKK